jgi:hypothetical protein
MSKSKKTLTTTTAQAPIAAEASKPALYMLRLPSNTREKKETYIVPAGSPMGRERWLAKKSYVVKKDGKGFYVILSEAQHSYYAKEGINGMEPYSG